MSLPAMLLTLSLTLAAFPVTAGNADDIGASTSLTTRQRIDLAHAEAAFSRYLRAWSDSSADGSNLRGVFDSSAVLELTMTARPQWSVRVRGPQAIAEYVEAMRSAGGEWKFSNVRYFPTLERGVVYVQYEALGGGMQRGMRNVVVVDMNADRIVRLRDFNSAPLLDYTTPGNQSSPLPAARLIRHI